MLVLIYFLSAYSETIFFYTAYKPPGYKAPTPRL